MAGLLLALLVAVVVAVVRSDADEAITGHLGTEERQRTALAQLAELEFEYQTGKIGEKEYRDLKAPLARVALRARAELRELTGEEGSS